MRLLELSSSEDGRLVGRVGSSLARKAAYAIHTRALARAAELEENDDALDDLHRHLFTIFTTPSWDHGVLTAVDIRLDHERSKQSPTLPIEGTVRELHG